MFDFLKSVINLKNERIYSFLLTGFFITSILILIFVVKQNLTLQNIKNRSKTLKVGKFAPEIRDKTVTGQEVNLPDGQSILLFFFNTTCNSCKRSLPYIKVANDSLRKKDIKMIGICSEKSVSISDYLTDFQLNIPIIFDKKGKIFSRYFIHYVPTIVWIDKEKRIRYIQSYGEDVNQVFQNLYKMTVDEK